MNDTPRTDAINGPRLMYGEAFAKTVTAYANQLETQNNALRARVESASAIITELLARTAKCDCRESDDAVAAAMAWLNDHK